MSPWEFKVGQVVGYKPRGEKWRARVTAIERDGKPFVAEIPVIDEVGEAIQYDGPPSIANPIWDYENYYLVEDVSGTTTEPWLAARLDHQNLAAAWKSLAERVGLREPYYQALATLMERWAPVERRGDLLDDVLVLMHAAWTAGAGAAYTDCMRFLEQHGRMDEVRAIRDRMP